jgi:hypothetical protein
MMIGWDLGTADRARDTLTSRAQIRYFLFIYCFFFPLLMFVTVLPTYYDGWAGIGETRSGARDVDASRAQIRYASFIYIIFLLY